MSRNFRLRLMVALLFLAALHLAALPSLSATMAQTGASPELGAPSKITTVCLMPLSPVIADSKPQDSSNALQKFSDPVSSLASDIEVSVLGGQELDSDCLRSSGQIQKIPYWLLYRSLLI